MEVRHQGGRLTRAGLAGVALVAGWLMFAAPARAEHELEWSPVSAGVPDGSGVTFRDAASTGGGAVVVVGADADSVEIRRRPAADGTWLTDRLVDADGADGLVPDNATGFQLDAVALRGSVAWAVGKYMDPADGSLDPLVIHLDGSPGAPVAQDWRPVGLSSAGMNGLPVSIALKSDSAVGLIGDDSGKVYKLTDDGSGNPSVGPGFGPVSPPSPPAGEITGISLFSGTGDGYAVSKLPAPDTNDGAVRIYSAVVQSSQDPQLVSAPFVPDQNAGTPSFAGVAAISGTQGIAIQPRDVYWELGAGGAWSRRTTTFVGDQLEDVSMTSTTAGVPVAVVAGADETTAGTVWRRVGTGSWEKYSEDLSPSALQGVVAVTADEFIAVGGGGVVKRGTPKAHPVVEDPPPDPGDDEEQDGDDPQTSVVVNETDPPTEGDPPADPKPCTKPKLRGQNVRDIKVRDRRRAGTGKGKLVIAFRLRRAARVRILALNSGKVVGKRARLLGRGRHTLRVRYRKPPEKVRIKARLVKSCDKSRRGAVRYVSRDTRTGF